ncbi:hypothetical protein [Rhizobium sp. CF080]|uniref:hypothetical protein n=1 Tax=Rhizobium sp. (strain CF080) TaxID=1144310 RepID=UPI0009DE9426|nr:hypothetical protein [Rhizobium sp. CF080]
MSKRIASVLALTIAATVLSGVGIPAAAQDLQLRVGPDGIRPVIREPRERERDRPRGGCSSREARAAARDEGLRDATVVRETQRSITVEGVNRRGRVETVTFANARGCPAL